MNINILYNRENSTQVTNKIDHKTNLQQQFQNQNQNQIQHIQTKNKTKTKQDAQEQTLKRRR